MVETNCYGNNAHSVGGATKCPERWSNYYSFVLEATEFALILFFGQAAENQAAVTFWRRARGLVVSASASVLVGREADSRPGLTKALEIGTVAFLPGARCAKDL